MNEQWKDIPGYEGLYQVSTHGRVKSLKFGKDAIMGLANLEGYKKISLSKKLKSDRRTYCVHRLVAMTFMPNPENKKVVNHIDRNRANNHIDNLEWATHKENSSGVAGKGVKVKVLKFIEESNAESIDELIAYINTYQ